MADYTMEIATEYNFSDITVYKQYRDGVQYGWCFVSNEGYVMYDTEANATKLDPATMESVPVTYYYTSVYCPLNYLFEEFTWVAVPRDSVDESYIR